MKSSVNAQTVTHFWHASSRHRRDFWLTMVIPVQGVINNTIVPLFIGKILASLSGPIEHSYKLLVGLAFAMIIGVLLNYIGFAALFRLQAKVMGELEMESFEGLLRRGVSFHNNNIAGKLVTDSTEYPNAYNVLCNNLITVTIPFFASIIIGLAIVTSSSPILGLVTFIMTLSVLAVAIYQTVSKTEQRNERHAARRSVTAHLADTITNVQNVKIFAHETDESGAHQKLSDKLVAIRRRDWIALGKEGSGRIAVLMVFELIFLAVIIQQVHHNHDLLGIGIFTFSYALNLGNRLFDIGSVIRSIDDALLDASDTTILLGQTPEILDASDAKQLKVKQGEVRFNDVGFFYTDNANPSKVFDDLLLNIEPGEKVGLVGPSGGGKSSLVKLVLRFEDIQVGSITVDGQDISKVTQKSLREAISYVPQEPLLFHRTIKDNIMYGKPNAPDAALKTAAEQAFALDFIEKLPHGFDTVVGERGVKLSGGQRQRVAIARAMLKNAPILVLDEATSALDSESEVLIQDALWKLMEDRTAIVIAHRLSTVQKMDRIVVLDNGQIIEQGTHKQLLRKKGMYAKLWAHQSGGFIEE